jgi:HD-GYP domain-containing protein (c-di-GMP phosphodiesterase class II)
VPDVILRKPEGLTVDEYETVKQHAGLGAQIASEVLSEEQVAWIRHHHERYDGSGYPDGMRGESIPDGAQLLALADAWDVMTSDRPYKAPMRIEEALAECRTLAARQFGPRAVEALARLWRHGRLTFPAQVARGSHG